MPLPALLGAKESYNPYVRLTPFNATQLSSIMNDGNKVVITNPKNSKFEEGQIVTIKDIDKALFEDNVDVEFKCGGEAPFEILGCVKYNSSAALDID